MSMNPFNLLTKGMARRGSRDNGYYKLLPKNPLPNFSAHKGAKAAPASSPVVREASQTALFEAPKPAHVPAPALPKAVVKAAPAIKPLPVPEVKPKAELKAEEKVEPKVVHAVRAVPAPPPQVPDAVAAAPKKPVTGAVVEEGPAKPAVWTKWAELAASWMRQWTPGRKPEQIQQKAVQTELALERVKVLRNDLAEDDLEVVAVRAKANKEPKAARAAKSEHEQKPEPGRGNEQTAAHP